MKSLCFIAFTCFALGAAAQDSLLMNFMTRGMALHDAGNYGASIEEYQQALDLEPENAFVNYEMALSYYYMGEMDAAIRHAKNASAEESENGLQAVILLGSIYDERGKYKQSVKILKKGLKRFGDYYLLWYNLGVTAWGNDDLELAKSAFLEAVKNKPDHGNSQLALAQVLMSGRRNVEAIYPLMFFLLIEPDGERAKAAYLSLDELMGLSLTSPEVPDEGSNITINLAFDKKQSQAMRSAALMLSMLEASRQLDKYEGWSPDSVDVDIMRSFLSFMSSVDHEGRQDYFTEYYFPFFGAIAESEHLYTFYHYIRKAAVADSETWCKGHMPELDAMFEWLDTLEGP